MCLRISHCNIKSLYLHCCKVRPKTVIHLPFDQEVEVFELHRASQHRVVRPLCRRLWSLARHARRRMPPAAKGRTSIVFDHCRVPTWTKRQPHPKRTSANRLLDVRPSFVKNFQVVEIPLWTFDHGPCHFCPYNHSVLCVGNVMCGHALPRSTIARFSVRPCTPALAHSSLPPSPLPSPPFRGRRGWFLDQGWGPCRWHPIPTVAPNRRPSVLPTDRLTAGGSQSTKH